MIYKVFITTDSGRIFYIDRSGSITGLFPKTFESRVEAEEYAKTQVRKTFPSYKIYVEEYVSPYARSNYQVNA